MAEHEETVSTRTIMERIEHLEKTVAELTKKEKVAGVSEASVDAKFAALVERLHNKLGLPPE